MKDKWFFGAVAATFIFILFNIWITILNSFQLNNYWIIDTTTLDQAMSSTIFSHLFFEDSVPLFSFFSVHATSLLFVITPFYSIYPNFISTYLIEFTMVYSASIPLYLMTKEITGSTRGAFLFSLSYLFYPSFMLFNTSAEEIIMLIGPAIFSVYFYYTNRKIPFIIAFLLMLSTIEFAPFIGLFFFFYILVDKNVLNITKKFLKRDISLRGFSTPFLNFFVISSLAASLIFLIFDMRMTLFFSQGTHPIFINIEGTNFFSIQSLLTGLQTDSFTKLLNILFYNGPFMFLAVLSPIVLLQIPWALVTIFSSTYFYFAPANYYGSFLSAFVPVGFLLGLKNILKDVKPNDKKKFAIKFITVVLVLNLLFFTGVGTFGYYHQVSSTDISNQDQGLLFLSQQLKQGQGVNVGVNDLPITGIYDWNVTYYGVHTNYVIFQGGPPYSLSGYGFYAADGPFVMYKDGYSGVPKFNYYDFSQTENLNQMSNFNFYSPPGNYTLQIKLNNTEFLRPISTGVGSSVKSFFLPLGSAIAIPFSVNRSGELKAVATNFGYGGSFVLGGSISSLINGSLNISTSTDFNTQYFTFNDVFIQSNKTYYFWYYPNPNVSSNSGGVTLPESLSNGTSYLGNIGSNGISNITKVDFTIPITLLFQSNSSLPMGVSVNVDGTLTNASISDTNLIEIPVKDTTGHQLSVSVDTNLTNYFAYYGSNISVEYFHQENMPSLFILDNPTLILISILAVGLGIIFVLYWVDLDRHKKLVHLYSRTISVLSFGSFWAFFGLSFTGIIPMLYNGLTFKIIGSILAISLLVTVITYDWERPSQ